VNTKNVSFIAETHICLSKQYKEDHGCIQKSGGHFQHVLWAFIYVSCFMRYENNIFSFGTVLNMSHLYLSSYGPDVWGIGVQFLSGTRECTLCSAQTGSGAHSSSYLMTIWGEGGHSVMLVTHLHLVSRLRTHRSVPPLIIHLHGMVCTELSTGSTYLYLTKYPSIALTCLDSGQQSTSSEIMCIGVIFLQQLHQD
jgi:hypothetical protein